MNTKIHSQFYLFVLSLAFPLKTPQTSNPTQLQNPSQPSKKLPSGHTHELCSVYFLKITLHSFELMLLTAC